MRLTLRVLAGMLFVVAVSFSAHAATVEGRLLYEKIPATLNGLDLANPVPTPAPRVLVELRRSRDLGAVVAQGATTDEGRYRLDVPDDVGELVLVAHAVSGRIVVANPASNRVWFYLSSAFDPARAPQELLIRDRDRLSGPFNILATIRRANRALLQIEPDLPLDEARIVIYWSPTNLVGTFFDVANNRAAILGDRGVDSDEFDDSVILHEYAHYLAKRFSRDDSPMGPHFLGEKLDPRLAWSEGWANFFAQAVLGRPYYIDTMGPDARDVLAFDLSREVTDGDTPGYWSEDTVGSFLWHCFAAPGAGSGSLGLGLEPIWRVLREYFPTRVFPYLLTLADGLILQNPALQSEITHLLAKRSIEYRYGVVPPVADPFPRLIEPGVPVTGRVASYVTQRWNLFDSAHYYKFRIETDRNVEIQLRLTRGGLAPGPADLVLAIYDERGERIAVVDEQRGEGSMERFARRLPSGRYVIGVESYLRSAWGVRFGQGSYELKANF